EQSIPSHVVYAGSDREHMDLDVADVSPQPSTKQLDEGFITMVYPKSDSKEESEKVMLGADEGGQSERQAGPDPGAQAEGQTGSDADAQDESQAGSNLDETSHLNLPRNN
nr:hypothetical protein [Tanacetum cinerariifolium]GFD00301.1 hypothetical protein [Tanacetum cinerariifolium]